MRSVPLLYSMRNLARRPGTSALCITIFTAEVAMVLVFLGLYRGMATFMETAADARNVVVLQPAVAAIEHSSISQAHAELLKTFEAGPVSPELLFPALAVLPSGADSLPVRGVEVATATLVRGIEWVAGRPPTGDGEAALGSHAARRSRRAVGGTVLVDGRPHRVVGLFSGPALYDAEVWIDLPALQRLTDRLQRISVAAVRLREGMDLPSVQAAWSGDLRLGHVDVRAETDYFREQKQQAQLFALIGTIFGGLLGFGVLFGTSNSMLAVVDDRRPEFAVLRVLGFRQHAVFAALVAEIVTLATAGALLAIAMVAALRDVSVRQLTASFRSVDVAIAIAPADVAAVLVGTLILAIASGLAPAARAARTHAAEALRR